MATKKKAAQKKSTPVLSLVKTVTAQLDAALPVLKEKLGEKEFRKRIKKAAKKLVAGVKKTKPQKAVKKVKKVIPVKKKAAKAVKKK